MEKMELPDRFTSAALRISSETVYKNFKPFEIVKRSRFLPDL